MSDKLREEFQKLAFSDGTVIVQDEHGKYRLDFFEEHYQFFKSGYEASLKKVIIKLPEKVLEEDEFDKGHNCAIDYCTEAIKKAGIKVAYD